MTNQSLPAALRLQKEFDDLDLPPQAELLPLVNDSLFNFKVKICPEEGYWRKASYTFEFNIPAEYPYKRPKVICRPKIFHPNIDYEGNICLNILRESWTPVLSIESVIYGLLHLFYDPNASDPLNERAADILREDPQLFEEFVQCSLRGETVDEQSFSEAADGV